MNENVLQKEGKAFRPWSEDGFITKVELPGIRQDQDRVGIQTRAPVYPGGENRRKLSIQMVSKE